jgi:hypothetical protein
MRLAVAFVRGRGATPSLGGGQVAVSPSYATFTWHVTSAAYSGVQGMYVPYNT